MDDIRSLPDEEVLKLNPWKTADGSSRSVTEAMSISELQSQIRQGVRPQVQALLENKTPSKEPIATRLKDARVVVEELLAGELPLSDREIPESEIAKLQTIIERLELNFPSLEEKILKKSPKKPRGPLEARLLLPFDVVKINAKNNSCRNHLQLRKKAAQEGFTTIKGDSYQFFYGSLPEKLVRNNQRQEAGMDCATRLMQLPKHFNPDSVLDQLSVYHEAFHLYQDDVLRQHWSPQKHASFYAQGGVIVDFEVEAYASQLMVADIITDGEVANLSIDPGKKEHSEKLLKLLGGTNDQLDYAYTLLLLGKTLFGGSQNPYFTGVSPEFFKHIIRRHSDRNLFKLNQGMSATPLQSH